MKNCNFRISGQNIQPTSHIKYLVVTLQDDLHWLGKPTEETSS